MSTKKDFGFRRVFFETKIFLIFRFGQFFYSSSLSDSENHEDVSDYEGGVIKFVFII